jgi:hypothetical protein
LSICCYLQFMLWNGQRWFLCCQLLTCFLLI